MNLLLLGPPNLVIREYLKSQGNSVREVQGPIDTDLIRANDVDFIISYGYRHIIRGTVVDFMRDRIVNLHISYLPWNRGADPNLWSFLEDTPKGVTIHYVDEGIDTGDIISQRKVQFNSKNETLASTYHSLHKEMTCLFQETWPLIARGGAPRRHQLEEGTLHRLSDKEYFRRLLARGWDTPVDKLRGKGAFYLREVRTGDKNLILEWRNSPNVSRYMYTDHHITHEEHEQWFNSAIRDPKKKYWIIMYHREPIGLANLYDIDMKNMRCFWAFYVSGEKARGKGIGSYVEYQVMRYVFEDLGFNKLCCEVLSFNKPVIAMHKSFGFREEGIYRQHIMKNGEYLDVVSLAMLKGEWDERKGDIETKLKTKGVL